MQRHIFTLAFIAGTIAGCTVPNSKARRILEGAGYTDIDLGGYAWFDCSEDDSLASDFTAKGPNGQIVHGAVCCGMLAKNCTIRLD